MNKQIIAIAASVAILGIALFSMNLFGKESLKTSPKNVGTTSISSKPLAVATPAPSIVLKDLNGTEYDLSKMTGEKIYVKFWASWCSICLAGLEEVDQLAGQTNDFKIFTIVSPNSNGEQNAADFTEWFKSLEQKNIIVLLDENGVVAKQYGVRAYPTSVFIASDGALIKTVPGHMDNESIKTIFEGIQ